MRCIHCYSESSPCRTRELSLAQLKPFVEEARTLGYSYIGISGGEPLLWKELEAFLELVRGIGFSTSLTTNGTLLTAKRVARLRQHLQLVAVSVDGPPAEHAAMRGSEAVFDSLCHGLEILKDAGLPYSLAFTLTRYNADRLSWLYEFADRMGAVGINVHPLCNFGAARTRLSSAVPDSTEFRVAAWLLALLVERRGAAGPVVTLDAIRRSVVEKSCWPLLNGSGSQRSCAVFSDLVPALVVESDGCIVPFIYGFPRMWSLGFAGGGASLRAASENWRRSMAPSIHTLVKSTLEQLAAAGEDYIDLFAALLEAAHLQTASAAEESEP